MPDSVSSRQAVPDAAAMPLSATALALGFALAAASDARASSEMFRLAPDQVMQNDDSGFEGEIGYARGLPYEVMQGYAVAEGDMVLGRVDATGRLQVPMRRRGLGQSSNFERWPDGIVPYAFHPGLTELQQSNVEAAVEELNEKTRMVIVPASSPEAEGYNDYILFEPSGGCASYVGRQLSEDAQSLWVADSCSIGSIVHEVSHALGLFHEHTRPDRDNYVQVVWDEIVDDKEFNFEIYDAGSRSYGEYDYGSIMHYGEYFFSKRGERTIVAPSNKVIGQRTALSDDDIATIDRMYATDLILGATTHETERGIEIDLSVGNVGNLGANTLVLRILGDPDTDWLSISADSGWNCLAHEEELRCERPRLVGQGSSRFTVVADAATTGADGLAMRLESRTLDLDPTSNGINDAVFDDEDMKLAAANSEPLPAASIPEGGSAPESGAASGEPEGGRTGTRASEDGGSGGGAGGALALLLAPLLALRRRARSRAAECG